VAQQSLRILLNSTVLGGKNPVNRDMLMYASAVYNGNERKI
jgi:hypothetical protein